MCRVNICNVEVDNLSMQEVLESIDILIEKNEQAHIVTPNVDHIVNLQRDVEFKRAYDDAALVLADGMPILWAASFLGSPLKEKISGSDLLPELCELAAKRKHKLFFLGGRPHSALRAAEILKDKYPGLQIVGVYSPPFGFEKIESENEKIIEMIKKAKPDILFVGLGSPKQEKWIFSFKNKFQAPLSIGIGVGFEFIAGVVKRAPRWMQKSGLEWFWRLLMEPERLWKRYLIHDSKFFWLVLKHKYDKSKIRQ